MGEKARMKQVTDETGLPHHTCGGRHGPAGTPWAVGVAVSATVVRGFVEALHTD